jgi:DNA-binding MarR family transcriptional regulator
MSNTNTVDDNRDMAGEEERRNALIGQLYFLGQIASTETALFQQAAAAKYGLGITDMKALSALIQEGAMMAGQLAQRLSLTTGAVTSVIDRLERRRFVRREPDPGDRRKVIVTVNQETIAAGNAGGNVYLSIGAAFNALYASYTTEQLEFLARYLQASVELTRGEIAKLARTDKVDAE